MKYIPKEKLIRKRKFTDEEFLNLYNNGLSDVKISKIFKCGGTCVRERRIRLSLVANYNPFGGMKLGKEELFDAEKRINESGNKSYKNNKEKYIERRRIWRDNNKEKIDSYRKEYYKIPKVKRRVHFLRNRQEQLDKEKEYRNKKEIKDKKKIYDKDYYQKNNLKRLRTSPLSRISPKNTYI